MPSVKRSRTIAAFVVLAGLLAQSGCVRRNTPAAPPVITAGGGHTCRAASTGTVDCWGANDHGQVGNSRTSLGVIVMSPVAGLAGVTSIAAGNRNHTCAVANAAVMCWGENGSGQLGNNSTADASTPVATGVTSAIDVAAGVNFSCAVKSGGGQIWCWGDNAGGQFGNGTLTSSKVPVNTGITGATRIAAGFTSTCAIFTGGTVKCWGFGPLGSATVNKSQSPLAVAGLANAEVLSAGLTDACALIQGGTVKCWGSNSHGELGNGVAGDSPTPVAVSGVSGATALAVGGSHACAVVTGGAVACWGDNAMGQLGVGVLADATQCGINSPPCSRTAVTVPGITGAVDIAAGDSHSCAILADSRVQCWGWNGYGQLGNGQKGNGGQWPVAVHPVFATPILPAVGGNFVSGNSCAMKADGTVKCWGYGGSGAIGNNTSNLVNGTPALAQGVTAAASISVGGHVCVTLDNLTVSCWGSNNFGELGTAAANPKQLIPVGVAGIGQAILVMAGRLSTCAIAAPPFAPPSLLCWGVNNNGQLGVPSGGMSMCTVAGIAEACTGTPTLVPGIQPMALSGGSEHTCAVLTNGTVRCFGSNSSHQLGGGPGTTAPLGAPAILGAVAIASGDFHNCVLLSTGGVSCWGRNRAGQVGNGTLLETGIPTAVTGITNAIAIAASGDVSCALLGDGTVNCWGDNGIGSLGQGNVTGPEFCGANNTNPCSKTPVTVPGIANATAISSSVQAMAICVALADRTMKCWGGNGAGELGRGTSGGFSATPGLVIGL